MNTTVILFILTYILSSQSNPCIKYNSVKEYYNQSNMIVKDRSILYYENKNKEINKIKDISIAIKYNTQLACDTDGAKSSSKYAKSDPAYCKTTSLTIFGKPIDSTKVNYIVYPHGNYRSDTEKGMTGLVIDLKTGEYIFVVCGDCKENSKYTWREMSLRSLWDLGYKDATGKRAPSGRFLTIILKDSKISSYSKNISINRQIESNVLNILNKNNINIDTLIEEVMKCEW